MDKARKKAAKEQKRKQAARKAKQTPASLGTPDAYLRKSLELLKARQDAKAEAVLRECMLHFPNVAEPYANLILALERQGKHREALAIGAKCAAEHPQSADALNNYGALLKFDGQLDLARQQFEQAVHAAPALGEAWRNLTSVKTYSDPNDPDLPVLASQAQASHNLTQNDPSMQFALAKALEDLGQYDESFRWYARGNRRMRGRVKYERRQFEDLVQSLIELQGDAYFAGPGPKNPSQAQPILIVGMPRSGSSLIEQILASHPEVVGTGELPELGHTLGALAPNTPGRIRAVATSSPEELARLGRVYWDRLQKQAPGATRIADKFLMNFLHLGFLAKALPGARVIHSRREAMDNCLACYKVLFTSNIPFTYDFEDLAHFHVHLQRLMAHWAKHLPNRLLEVDYEEVVRDLEGQTRRILDFAGLPWHDDCLRFFETKRRVLSASSAQVRKPLYSDSVAKWKRFESHLAPLEAALEKYRRGAEARA